MTTYDEAIKHLFSLGNHAKTRQDLSFTKELASKIGNPQDQYPTVHIAGTNGKGSVAFKIAEALRLEGYEVGLYTSPHLFTYRERIVVNHEMISEEEVIAGLEKLFQLSPDSQFFELTTLLAFDHFAKKNVDIAVIETGLGGRLDMTNIIHPLLSIITMIDFDHQEILGSTLEAIGREKGGIIKEHTPVVLGAKANLPILRKMAHFQKAPLYLVSEDGNDEIAYKALEVLHPHFPTTSLAKMKGIAKRPCCRFQMLEENVVADVAHNPSAFKRLFAEIRHQFPEKKIALLLALSKDKPLEPLIPLFKEHVEEIALFSSKHERLKDPKELARELNEGGYQNVKVFKAASAAFKHLINGENNRFVTIAGSFYMMEEAFASLTTV